MATSERDIRRAGPTPARKAPAADGRRVIQAPTTPSGVDGLSIFGAIFAAFASLAAHALLILLFWTIPSEGQVNAPTKVKKQEEIAIKEKEEEEKKKEEVPEAKLADDKDLTNEKESPEDGVSERNIMSEKIDDAVVPGPTTPLDSPGIENAPPRPPDSSVITPPKGIGGGDPYGQSVGPMGPNGVGLAGGDAGFGTGGFKDGVGDGWTGAFAGRTGAMKDQLLAAGGGNKQSEAAVASGLSWLALHQGQDGHWSITNFNQMGRDKPLPAGKVFTYNYGNTMGLGSADDDVAATGLALLPFLAAGQTHKATKEEQKVQYHKGVHQGLTYLISKQDKTSGRLSHNFYAHGIATIALCEAYGLTSDPMLKRPAQAALDYIVASQHDAGGWRYRAKEAGDLSVTGWQLMALKSGQMSGLRVPAQALRGAETFVSSCEVQDTGTYTYVPGGGATPSMTATGMLCRQYLGVNPRNPKLGKGVEFLKRNPPTSQDLYYLYYATQVMHHMGGDAWAYWNEGPNKNDGIRDTLIRLQDTSAPDGRTAMQRGSWYFPNGHTAPGGRLMSTSLALLCLEVYYRHLPLYRGEVTETKPMN